MHTCFWKPSTSAPASFLEALRAHEGWLPIRQEIARSEDGRPQCRTNKKSSSSLILISFLKKRPTHSLNRSGKQGAFYSNVSPAQHVLPGMLYAVRKPSKQTSRESKPASAPQFFDKTSIAALCS